MHDKVVKVLHMTKLGAGGISTLTININKCLNLEKVRFDYLVFENEKTFYEDVVEKLNAKKRVVDVTKYSNKLLLYWKKYIGVKSLLKRYPYDVVHVDASTPLDVVIGFAAKHTGVKTVILHSHISGDTKKSMFRTFYMNFCRFLMKYTFTHYFAISDSSAKFMFPRSIYRKRDFKIYKNGIIADNYKIDLEKREQLRNKLGVTNKFVLGHIGRFSPEKNHVFILEVFKEILKVRKDSVLLLIGTGVLKDQIETESKRMGIDRYVIFYGTSHDVPGLLNVMDSFIFPSQFEGLGISAIEAQCSGLHTFCSEGIPNETNISDRFHQIAGYNPCKWAKRILNEDYTSERMDKIDDVKKAGFDILTVAKELENFYIQISDI